MPKAHKPGRASNITLVHGKRSFIKKNEEFWAVWNPMEIKTYIELPAGLGKFAKDDPRITDWRRKINKKGV